MEQGFEGSITEELIQQKEKDISIMKEFIEHYRDSSTKNLSKEKLNHFIKSVENIEKYLELYEEDYNDLEMLHETNLEHSTEIENELSIKNEAISKLIDKMKRYLSDQLYQKIMGGQIDESTQASQSRKILTIFFSDIVRFSDLTDSVEPEVLSDILNSYLDAMAEIAKKWGGTIDKFIGDAIMIFFGDNPEADNILEAQKCVQMAIEMQLKMETLRKMSRRMGLPADLEIRIGINTGVATIGNFGSKSRMDYTVIGGNVNAASRLESSSSHGGIHISESTYNLVRSIVNCEPRGSIKVKGIHKPIETFEVLGLKEKDTLLSETIEVNDTGFSINEITFNKEKTSELEKQEMIKVLESALNIIIDQRDMSRDQEKT